MQLSQLVAFAATAPVSPLRSTINDQWWQNGELPKDTPQLRPRPPSRASMLVEALTTDTAGQGGCVSLVELQSCLYSREALVTHQRLTNSRSSPFSLDVSGTEQLCFDRSDLFNCSFP